ncbi:hypothetical protein [Natrinema sp. H-ect4]|uniref:hypothetical protein n=1 Tax=Natrinema sp. H-ect4 TaxID=3242699 RepID=UPI0035A9504F
MGHRALLIKQDSEDSFRYVYSHWGANKFKRLTDEYYYSEKDISDEDISQRFQEIWEQSDDRGEEIKSGSSLDDIVDVEDIGIEAYIIEDKDGEIHIVIPTITSEVNVAVTRPLKEINDLHRLKGMRKRVQHYIKTAAKQGLEEDTIREGVRTTVSEFRRDSHTLLIDESDSAQVKVFNRISRVMA